MARRFDGYEMHVGRTSGPDCARPLLRFADGRVDGAISPDGRVAGAYVHGLFADDRQRAAWLASLGAASELAYEAAVERTLDALAAHLPRISISTRCSASRDERRSAASASACDHAGAPVEPQRRAGYRRRRLAAGRRP